MRQTVDLIPKTWGYEIVIVNNDRYCGKSLVFHAGSAGSLHYHKNKHETFYLLNGHVKVATLDLAVGTSAEYDMRPGACLELPPGIAHKVTAIQASEILEFSTHHDDADVYRIFEERMPTCG